MARVKLDELIIGLSSGTGLTATVTVTNRDSGATATLYQAETGGSTYSNPITATNGRLGAWVEPGRYNLSVASSGFANYVQAVEADPAASRGKCIVATEEALTNNAFDWMPTPDRVSNLVLPTDGLFIIAYQAMWKESLSNGALAAIFLDSGSGPVEVSYAQYDTAAPQLQSAACVGSTDVYAPLATFSLGLAGRAVSSTTAYTGDVTTGQIVGGASLHADGILDGGPCCVFAAAGTYTVGIQFRGKSGPGSATVTAKNRKLWVEAKAF